MRGLRFSHVAVPLTVVGAVMMMVVPIPPALLDTLLAINLAFGVLILLSVVFLKDAVELSVFPALLLITTLVRLALNVSSTRLILLEAYAGRVIETFGQFVVGGNVVVGLVVFLILMIVQFAVIVAGAGRVAEVSARFTLDAMPGKQMAIDSDLSAGLINDKEAKQRRERISQEAEFHGAMDGAGKFVKGDAIASLVIVLINLIGGLAVGVAQMGMPALEAADTYALLTVGDGLVSQIPALLLSLSTGLLVTRVASDESFGPQLGSQFLSNPRVLFLAGTVVAALGILPGLPLLVFGGVGAALIAASVLRQRRQDADGGPSQPDEEPDDLTVDLDPNDPLALSIQAIPHALGLDLAPDLLDLYNRESGGRLSERVDSLRAQLASSHGFVLPEIHMSQSPVMDPGTYQILVNGVPAGRGRLPRGRVLAIPADDAASKRLARLGGEQIVEPAYGVSAFLVGAEHKAALTVQQGVTVVDRSSALVTHLRTVALAHARELFTREHTSRLVEGLRSAGGSRLADEVGSRIPESTLDEVLKELLTEGVPVRNIGAIIGTLSAQRSLEATDTLTLVDAVRRSLRREVFAASFASTNDGGPPGSIVALTLDHELSRRWSRDASPGDPVIPAAAAERNRVAEQVQQAVAQASGRGMPAALLTPGLLRRPLRSTLKAMGVDVPTLSLDELPDDVVLEPGGVIDGN